MVSCRAPPGQRSDPPRGCLGGHPRDSLRESCGRGSYRVPGRGRGPIDILFVLGWVTHLERMWTEPRFARFYTRLASFSRVMLFDKRGVGFVRSGLGGSAAVARGADGRRARRDGRRGLRASGGARRLRGRPMAMLFAATYPERTIALTLFGTSACWNDAPDYPYRETEQEQTDSRRSGNGGSGSGGPRSSPGNSSKSRSRRPWPTIPRRRRGWPTTCATRRARAP